MKSILCFFVTFGLITTAFAETAKVAQSTDKTTPATQQATGTPPTTPPVNEAKETPATTTNKQDINPETEKALEPLKEDAASKKATGKKKDDEIATPPAEAVAQGEQKSRIGLHFALGIPHPLTAGLDYISPTKKFAFALIGGSAGGTTSGYDISITNVELQFRYHPSSEAFFWGLAMGNHIVKVAKTETFSGQSVKGEATVNAGYVTPELGWVKVYPSGFMLGFELGWLVPTSTSTDFTSNAPSAVTSASDYVKFVKDVKDQGDQLGKTGLPMVSLLRLGWTF